MIWLASLTFAAGLSVQDGRVGFATRTAVGVVDGTGRVEWSVAVSGVEPSAAALLGRELWVFADGQAWVFDGGRMTGVYGQPGGTRIEATSVRGGVVGWTGRSLVRFGAAPVVGTTETPGVTGIVGAGFEAARPDVADRLPPGQPCTLFSATEAACGLEVLRRVRVADGVAVGTLPGTTVLASGPAGIVVGPTPAFVTPDGVPRLAFDPADAWAVGTDSVYAARDGEIRAIGPDGKTRWVARPNPAVPAAAGVVVEGVRTSLVVDRTTGAVLGGWLGAAPEATGEAKAKSYATVRGKAIVSHAEVGKGRKKRPAWTASLADGEKVLENAETIVIASETGWRLVDGRSGKGIGQGDGAIEDRRRGWMRVRGAAGVALVRMSSGERMEFPADAEVVGVLDSGAVVVADRDLVITDPAGNAWRGRRPVAARVDGDLVLCQDAGVVYARDAAGAVRWVLPFAEALR